MLNQNLYQENCRLRRMNDSFGTVNTTFNGKMSLQKKEKATQLKALTRFIEKVFENYVPDELVGT